MATNALSSGYRLTRLVLDRSSSVQRNVLALIPSFNKRAFSAAAEESKSSSTIPPSEETEIEKKLKQEIEKLNSESKALAEKVADLDDKYKRTLADRENVRDRLTKQIQDAKLFGIQGFCKDLLEVADILGKATESVPKEEVKDNNPHLKNLYEGLTMTEAQLLKVFTRHGLLQVNPLNEKFDPNLHEALFEQEVQGKQPGTVVVVSKVGYKLHERCIRPALVGVAKGQ